MTDDCTCRGTSWRVCPACCARLADSGYIRDEEGFWVAPTDHLRNLLDEHRRLKARLCDLGHQIEDHPCSGCGKPLDTEDPYGCEACEGRFCGRGTCVAQYEDAAGGLTFCHAHAPEVPSDGT